METENFSQKCADAMVHAGRGDSAGARERWVALLDEPLDDRQRKEVQARIAALDAAASADPEERITRRVPQAGRSNGLGDTRPHADAGADIADIEDIAAPAGDTAVRRGGAALHEDMAERVSELARRLSRLELDTGVTGRLESVMDEESLRVLRQRQSAGDTRRDTEAGAPVAELAELAQSTAKGAAGPKAPKHATSDSVRVSALLREQVSFSHDTFIVAHDPQLRRAQRRMRKRRVIVAALAALVMTALLIALLVPPDPHVMTVSGVAGVAPGDALAPALERLKKRFGAGQEIARLATDAPGSSRYAFAKSTLIVHGRAGVVAALEVARIGNAAGQPLMDWKFITDAQSRPLYLSDERPDLDGLGFEEIAGPAGVRIYALPAPNTQMTVTIDVKDDRVIQRVVLRAR